MAKKNLSFYQKVYEVVKQIPEGTVLTYKDVARLAGSPKAARAVGMAMKNDPDKENVPCHRVVGTDGRMHGYAFGGVEKKMKILNREGVEFVGHKVDLEKFGWKS